MASEDSEMNAGNQIDEAENDLLEADEAAEEIQQPEDEDQHMDSDPDEGPEHEEIQLQNDSIAHFDSHTDSIFCIARHPLEPSVIATGGGDDTVYVWSTQMPSKPLPPSFESEAGEGRASLPALAKLTGHTDSVNCMAFTLPSGDYLLTGGLDGRIRAHDTSPPSAHDERYRILAEAQEVPEINWIAPCPHATYPNTFALGASDGSVWIYTVDPTDHSTPLQQQGSFYLHTEACTAGAWTPDGKLLATVSEDGSLYVWDPLGEAAAAGVMTPGGGQTVVGLTAEDARFAVEGGLYSVAIAPTGAFAVVGGAGGMIRVVGLPRLDTNNDNATQGMKGAGAKSKSGGGRKTAAGNTESGAATGQAGQILASLQAQGDGVETLAFSPPPATLFAAGSGDGSVAVYDWQHRFALRRHIKDAHDGLATVQVEFGNVEDGEGHLITSCGMDGVVRRWDTRGGTAATGQGLVGEWKGHRGEGEGGGVLGFVMGAKRIITAGDDGIGLVFEAA